MTEENEAAKPADGGEDHAEGMVDAGQEGEAAVAEGEGGEKAEGDEGNNKPEGEGEGEDGEGRPATGGFVAIAPKEKPKRELPKWVRPRKKLMVSEKVRDLVGDQYDQVQDAFMALDINGDGRVSMRELKTGIAMMDWAGSLSPEEIKEVMQVADVDENGFIDLAEFLRCFGPHSLSKEEVRLGLYDLSLAADGRSSAYLGFKVNNMLINDIEILGTYEHMQWIDISHNEVTDLTPLGRLPNLVKLNASHNRLESMLDFRAAEHLAVADLSYNQIHQMNDISQHRSLASLDLRNNRIRVMDGMSKNMNLTSLNLDNNQILQILGISGLPIKHLSMRNNRLLCIQGHNIAGGDFVILQRVLEANFDTLEEAFVSLDANSDGKMSRKEFLAGLKHMDMSAGIPSEKISEETGVPSDLAEFKSWFHQRVDDLLASMDVNDDGTIDIKEFDSVFSRPVESSDQDQQCVPSLSLLEYIDLSGNPITSLKGLEGHARLMTIKMADTAVKDLNELQHIAFLGMLETLDLEGSPVAAPSPSTLEASCFRLNVIQKLLPAKGKTKLSLLNGVGVVAEERVSAKNFHDADHMQFNDHKRDDSQDIPAKMYQ